LPVHRPTLPEGLAEISENLLETSKTVKRKAANKKENLNIFGGKNTWN